jgi:crotonobetaine/carnitine-CoA ligase
MPASGTDPAEPFVSERIDRLAAERPDGEAILFVDGPEWTWAELRRRVRDHAAGLAALGVTPGEFVLSWMPNGPLAVLNLLALNYLGAVYVPINTAYRGQVLAHVLKNSGAKVMIAHGELVGRLADVERAAVERVVVVGDERPDIPGLSLIDQSALAGDGAGLPPQGYAAKPWDTQMVIYTSGTTGPSKGVLSSYRHARTGAIEFRNIGPTDRHLSAMPMFHVGGAYALLWALYHAAPAILAESFRTQDFWPIVHRYRVTTTGLLGSMVDFLNGQPPGPDDRSHTLKSVIVAPFTSGAIAFGNRFGVPLYTEFNMSELSVPLWAGPDPEVVGTCGLPRPGVELRLVDTQDEPVPEGATGELVLRMDQPWTVSHGYHNDPAATAATWRNGWFHTGDLFRRGEGGHYIFVDRVKDSLRRRGENVSSFEVESALLQHPQVREAAVVGVPAEGGAEDEVMAVLVADGTLDPAELTRFLEPRLAHFMIPRYVRQVDGFPRTPTQKIEKHRLRAEGVTADAWDREAAGVAIRRAKLERRG